MAAAAASAGEKAADVESHKDKRDGGVAAALRDTTGGETAAAIEY
jgi:hypothetical protein